MFQSFSFINKNIYEQKPELYVNVMEIYYTCGNVKIYSNMHKNFQNMHYNRYHHRLYQIKKKND